MKINEGEIMALEISEMNPEALFATGFEDCLVGYVEQASKVLAAYSREKCINKLMADSDMTWDEAEEYFVFNVVGAYVGENTPVFLTLL